MKIVSSTVSVSAVMLAASLVVAPQLANGKDSFYQGKTIKLTIRSSPGGGYDFYGRLMSRHLAKYISGEPKIIAINMPGAGGVVAANYMANRAKRDGTEIAILNRGIAIAQRMKVKGVKYDVGKLVPLGSPASASAVWVIRDDHPIKTMADLKGFSGTIKFSSTGAGSASSQMVQVLKANGYPVTVITGYSGMSEKVLAIVRGDVDATCCAYGSLRTHIKESNLRVLAKIGGHPDLARYIDVRDALSEEGRALTNFMAAPMVAGRPFFTTEGVPSGRVAALRKAFKSVVGDAVLKVEAKKARRRISFISGQEMERVYRGILNASDKVVQRFKKL